MAPHGTSHGRAKRSNAPALRYGWLTHARVAKEIGISVDTLQRWETRRIGPPCVRIARKVLYLSTVQARARD
jgi:DNA-binding transcriptional regulator YiaG